MATHNFDLGSGAFGAPPIDDRTLRLNPPKRFRPGDESEDESEDESGDETEDTPLQFNKRWIKQLLESQLLEKQILE